MKLSKAEQQAPEWQTAAQVLMLIGENGGEPKVVATCSTGYATTSEQCPLPDADVWNKLDGHWNTTPGPSDYLPTLDAGDLWKYDPDISPNATDQRWMQACLFAPTYPPPLEVSRPQFKK